LRSVHGACERAAERRLAGPARVVGSPHAAVATPTVPPV
jgi:hypothetical protein